MSTISIFQSSLEKAKSWVKELQRQANSNIVIAFVGNKIDLVAESAAATGSKKKKASNASGESTTSSEDDEDDDEDEADDATATPEDATNDSAANSANKRQVSREEAEAYAKEMGLLFSETSAKTGEGVVEVFTEIGESIPIHGRLSCKGAYADKMYAFCMYSQSYSYRSALGQLASQPRRTRWSCISSSCRGRLKQSRFDQRSKQARRMRLLGEFLSHCSTCSFVCLF